MDTALGTVKVFLLHVMSLFPMKQKSALSRNQLFLKNPIFKFDIIIKNNNKIKNGIFLKFTITAQTSTVRYQQRGKIFRDRSHTCKRSRKLKIDFA